MSTESMLYNGNHHLNDKLKSSSGKNGKLITSDKTNGIADMNGNSTNGSTSNSNLEEAFKAACDTIQNLPKNGMNWHVVYFGSFWILFFKFL